MIELLGKTQQELLKLLQRNKDGLTISELTEMLGVTRNAVKQHLSALQENSLVEQGSLYRTGGRPTQSYVLTEEGRERFPRQYSWFAEILLDSIRAEKDEKGLRQFLEKLADTISSRYLSDLSHLKAHERVKKVATILSQLGYEAEVVSSKDKTEVAKLEVSNCVFYQLANSCPEVCGFDINLLSRLTGQSMEQQSCIAKGGNVCCFGVKK